MLRTVRLGAVVLLVLGLLFAPGAMRPAAALIRTTIELTLERPVWHPHEQLVITGSLSSDAGPVGGATVLVGVNGDLGDTAHDTITAPDGSYRLELPVDEQWGFGGSTLTAAFLGDDEREPSDAMTIFQVAPDQVAPANFVVDPVAPGPVEPGQHVTLTGMLRNERNEPAEGKSVLAVADAGSDNRAFGTVDDQGRWSIDLVVPSTPGEWSEHFPAYRVPVVFEGDDSLAPAQHEVTLTLSRPPAAAPTSSPSPVTGSLVGSPTSEPSPAATATPAATSLPDRRAGAPPWLPVWLPPWVASPLFLAAAGGSLALLVGAAMLSHARRG